VDRALRRAMSLRRAMRQTSSDGALDPPTMRLGHALRQTSSDGALDPPTALLFAEDFLYVAHLLLNFAGDFLAGASISQIGIAERFSSLLLHFAFRFPDAAFDFIF